MRVTILLFSAGLVGCAGTSSDGGLFGGGTQQGGQESDGAPGDDGGGANESGLDDGVDSGQEPKLDTQSDPTETADDGSGQDGCDAVDLLFVIDNSPSMANDVASLIASFPGFVAGMEAALATTDRYHIGVTTTDPTFVQPGVDPACGSLGVLIEHSDAGACGPYASGGNFFTDDDDLAAAFECAATQGAQGSGDEHAIESAMLAVSSEYSSAGGCNDGFIRDDALLLVTIITDEDDHAAPDDPPDWHQWFVDQKGGLEKNIVVLTILMGPGASAECNANFNGPGLRLMEFTQMFEHGFVGDICEDDFTPFFADAIGDIADAFTACEPVPAG